jgi:hypothetical protein
MWPKFIVVLSFVFVAGLCAGCTSESPVVRHAGKVVSHVDSYGSGTGNSQRLQAAGEMVVGFSYGDPLKRSWKGKIKWALLRQEGDADVYKVQSEFISENGATVRKSQSLSYDGESAAVIVVNDQWAISIEPGHSHGT